MSQGWVQQDELEQREERVLLKTQALREERDRLAEELRELRPEAEELRGDVAHLRDKVDALCEERIALEQRIEHFEDVIEGVTARLVGRLAEPLEVEQVAARLVACLERALGFEQASDTLEVHDIFREMQSLREALEASGPMERSGWVAQALRDEDFKGDASCRPKKPTDRA